MTEMNTTLPVLAALIATLIFSETRWHAAGKTRLMEGLRRRSLPRSALWLVSRAIVIFLFIDYAVIYAFPRLSLPLGLLLFAAATAVHCLVHTLGMAAYELLKKR